MLDVLVLLNQLLYGKNMRAYTVSPSKSNGLGQHMRKVHPLEHEATKNVARVKAR